MSRTCASRKPRGREMLINMAFKEQKRNQQSQHQYKRGDLKGEKESRPHLHTQGMAYPLFGGFIRCVAG
ncbi:hypothetical protein OUZ56_030296 [Daphnia magna]|uniref:Uncharacterized protein n=1 Tax=Daphnia magna TaxID=35525 RepID=A0ABQ9ZQW2_9CRUS|nr:hypothetical protein OUZ56_030296 [Daphnia magna]